jgi:hypothetical protein
MTRQRMTTSRQKLLLSDEDLFAEVGQSLGKGATFTDAIKRGRQVFENLKRQPHPNITDFCFSALSPNEPGQLSEHVPCALGEYGSSLRLCHLFDQVVPLQDSSEP